MSWTHYFVLSYSCFLQEKSQRRRNRNSRESKERERMAEKLWGPFLFILSSYKWENFPFMFFGYLWESLFTFFSLQETRDGRVDSWRNFQAKGKTKKEKKNRSFLKPPKVKMEQREWCLDGTSQDYSSTFSTPSTQRMPAPLSAARRLLITLVIGRRPALRNVVLCCFLMYIFVIWTPNAYFLQMIKNDLSSISVTDKCCFVFYLIKLVHNKPMLLWSTQLSLQSASALTCYCSTLPWHTFSLVEDTITYRQVTSLQNPPLQVCCTQPTVWIQVL